MTSIKLLAPAKVNLFLKVLNKSKDGYHNILTLFERISLADRITISKIPEGIELSSDVPITRDPKDDLIYKAAELILWEKKGKIRGCRGKEGKCRGVRIRVQKKIPIAAGLGGGSSDAAGTLIGMNRLFSLGLKKSELMALGKKLGADVPFFIFDEPFAIGTARGDKLKAVNITAPLWHLIVFPGRFKAGTADIYKEFDRLPKDLTLPRPDAKMSPSSIHALDLGELEAMLYNDLQSALTAKEDRVGRVIDRLVSSLNKRVIVSGSGPSLFCLYANRKEAQAAKDKLFRGMSAVEKKCWKIFVAKTLRRA